MNVLRHDHITEQREIVAVSHVSQNSQENIAAPFGGEKRQPLVATASDKVQVPEPIAAL